MREQPERNREIYRRWAAGDRGVDLAQKCKVTRGRISQICHEEHRRATWRTKNRVPPMQPSPP